MLIDAPIVTDDPENQLRWKPQNYDQEFLGEVTAAHALVNSMNIPAVKALENLGIHEAVQLAYELGITSKLNEDFSIALGSSCVVLWDLVNVYAIFDRGGTRARPSFVRKVEDRFGRTLEDHTYFADAWAPLADRVLAGYASVHQQPEQVMSPETAYITTNLLHQVTQFGTAAAAGRMNQKWKIAGKTGTTNDSFDAWFMGFSHDLVTGVWVGYDKYDAPMGRYENGGRAALPIWQEFMERSLQGRPDHEWEKPATVEMVTIDMRSGRRKGGGPGTRAQPFKIGTAPSSEDEQQSVDPNLFMNMP